MSLSATAAKSGRSNEAPPPNQDLMGDRKLGMSPSATPNNPACGPNARSASRSTIRKKSGEFQHIARSRFLRSRRRPGAGPDCPTQWTMRCPNSNTGSRAPGAARTAPRSGRATSHTLRVTGYESRHESHATSYTPRVTRHESRPNGAPRDACAGARRSRSASQLRPAAPRRENEQRRQRNPARRARGASTQRQTATAATGAAVHLIGRGSAAGCGSAG